MARLSTNLILNSTYQILALLVPLITTPYVSRVLGAENIGTYSYTFSIAYYFVLVIMLGVNNYGNREIAACRGNVEMLSKVFWNVYLLQVVRCIALALTYCVMVAAALPQYAQTAWIWIFYIVSAGLDISWLFFGLEQFKLTVIRNTCIKLATVLLIFIFVKGDGDLPVYAGIMSGGYLLSQVALWPFVKRFIRPVRPSFREAIKHIKPELMLFIPVLAFSLYSTIGKVMLGSISPMFQLGLYENTEKIIKVPKAIIMAIGTVMMPRQVAVRVAGDELSASKYFKAGFLLSAAISLLFMFGIMGCAEDFAPIFFGDEFADCSSLLNVFAIAIPFVGISNVVRTQYLIPSYNEKVYVGAVVVAAVFSVALNAVLIPAFGAMGAVIATVFAEMLVFIIQIMGSKKNLPYKQLFKGTIPFLIAGLFSFTCMRLLAFVTERAIWSLLVQISFGCLVFAVVAIIVMKLVDKQSYEKLIQLVFKKVVSFGQK